MTMRQFSITDPLPQGTVLLEASAGTGKTWTIAALVTRYVAEGVATLPEMLVVTFGRAASQELRARVREQLDAAERALADPPPDEQRDQLLTLLLSGDPAELAARRTRLRAALSNLDAATIATTHQFCQQVLRSLGVAGTTDASASLVEDLDDLLVEVVDDLYLRGFMGAGSAPTFSRGEALKIARRVVDDTHADLRPEIAERGSTPDRRVRFAKAVRTEMDVRKRRLQVMHYNDLLSQLADALKPEDSPARARMRARWRVVLVDEFQDTDPVQWQVLDRAFSGHAHAMVLIGDPKQAIYAFRGGDVVTYLQAAATATDQRTLPRNYRSDPGVVEALDTLLRGAHLGDEQIAVHPVSAHRSTARLAGAPSSAPVRVRQVLLKEHLGGDNRMGAVRPFIAQDLAQDVAALLASDATFDNRPVQARDVAVIAHKGKDLALAQRALHALGIPAVSTGGSTVLHSQAAHDWLALLEAMVAPHRSLLTRAAALTDLLGYAVPQLDAGGADLDDELAQRCREEGITFIGPAPEILGLLGNKAAARKLAVECDVPVVPGTGDRTSLTEARQFIADLAEEHDLLVYSDEIYEYITYDGLKHTSAATVGKLRERTMLLGGYSKTFSITGWRIGYLAAPADIMEKAAVASDLLYICAPHPLQLGVLKGLDAPADFYESMRSEYEAGRAMICDALEASGFKPYRPQGSYYVMADFSAHGWKDDKEASLELLKRAKVAAIPGSAFYEPGSGRGSGLLRFCYAKERPVLEEACKRLRTLK